MQTHNGQKEAFSSMEEKFKNYSKRSNRTSDAVQALKIYWYI